MSDSYVPSAGRFPIVRESAVSWFDTRQLAATAAKTIAATIVGSMSGRREIMAALDAKFEELPDYSDREGIWIDYVADSGDGWNASMSVAWLIGRDALVLREDGEATDQTVPPTQDELDPEPAAGATRLEGGEILIAGGDQIYPTASVQAYQRRFVDPLRCARNAQTPHRTILAIPGNHDWYDGLTSFIRLFCQTGEGQRWFGAWRTAQRRSYFALALPHGWWLWGVDTALEDDLDPPQYEYFRRQRHRLRAGDKVILCVAGPSWMKGARLHVDADPGASRRRDEKLAIIMRLARRDAGDVSVPLVLTGDHHYYARHRANVDGATRDYVVCGGGGAFGLGTLQVPQEIEVGLADGPAVVAARQAIFPDRDQSVELRRRVLGFPLKNPAFSALLAGVQIIAIWLLHTVGPHGGADAQPSWIAHAMESDGWRGLAHMTGDIALAVLRAPALLIATLAVLAAFAGFALSGAPAWRGSLAAAASGLLHGVLQIAGAVFLFWLVSQAVAATAGTGALARWVTVAAAYPVFMLYCGLLFGAYLFLAHKALGLHDQEVFSAQGVQDYKGFLRIRIDRDGATVYPVGLRRVARDWKGAPGVILGPASRTASNGKAQAVTLREGCYRIFDPVTPLAPHLIERPFTAGGDPA